MGAEEGAGPGLPVRTSRYRRTGRHSSPHQLSLPPEAPALVLAVPGAASVASDVVAADVAAAASASCPGITVEFGYLAGQQRRLDDLLHDLHDRGVALSVVVPLLAGPHPEVDTGLAGILAPVQAPHRMAAHLGPHPMLAEALHMRLAEAGLARAARAGRLSLVTAADGFIVGAAGGEEAVQAAGVVAVLLASRLTAPVAPAALTDLASLREAAERLQSAQVGRVALAPCLIGPEVAPGSLDAITQRTGIPCAAPLGSHPAVGHLAAMRYGAVLADPRLAAQIS